MNNGKYLWNENKILVRLLNNRLIIRVGGAFIKIKDFINLKNKLEMGRNSINQDHYEKKRKSSKNLDERKNNSSLTTTGKNKYE